MNLFLIVRGKYLVVLIVGASGGIGQALAENYASAGHRVIGTFYNTNPQGLSEKIELTLMDPTSETSVQSTLSKIYSLDLVINCVGFLSSDDGLPEKTIRKFEPHGLEESIRINTLPTLLIAKHAQRLLRQSRQSVFATISAKVGSIGDNQLGGWYSYRISKAALNMVLKTLSIEWSKSTPNCCVAALHPGTVSTKLSAPFVSEGTKHSVLSASQSAACMSKIVNNLRPLDTGRFWSWNGEEICW